MDKINMNITSGKVKRIETVVVEYKVSKKPTLDVEIERPYEVKATGQVTAVDNFTLKANGNYTSSTAKVSRMGLIAAIKAAYDAFKNACFSGGITEKDVQGVEAGVNNYNKEVDKLQRVAGKRTVIRNSKEMEISDLSDKEIAELEESDIDN